MYVRRYCLVVLGLCGLGGSGQLLADPASDASGESVAAAGKAAQPENLQEIIVTAQKRAQAASDVGLTMVVASGEQLVTQGVTDVADLAKIVPSLTTQTSGLGYTIYSLRGVNFDADQLSAHSAVAVYLDEAPLPYPATTAGSLLDVQRVEVLKGPQGTLFGQNSTGGSVNIIAAKPTADFAAGTEVSVNNWEGVSAQGYVSGPLTDTLRARFSASTDQFGSWQQEYFNGAGQTNGRANRGAARLLLDWTPANRLKISINMNGNFDHGEPQAFQSAGLSGVSDPSLVAPGLLVYPPPPADNRAAGWDVGFQPGWHNGMEQGVVRVDYDLNDNMTLTSQSSYINFDVRGLMDIDGTPIPSTLQGPFGNIASFSQEFRLTGKLPSEGLTYIYGANYQSDKIADGIELLTPYYSGLPHDSSLSSDFHVRYRTAGVFANADWEFVPGFTLTAGARYTAAHEALQGCLADGGNGLNSDFFGGYSAELRSFEGLSPPAPIAPGACVALDDRPTLPGGLATWLPYDANLSQNEHNVSWRGGLNYKPTQDSLIYGLVSRGYKAGSFPASQNTFASQFQPVKQEQLTSYEVGTKLSLLNGMIQPNIAAFYYQYKDKQVLAYYLDPTLGLLSTYANVPNAQVEGVDADIAFVPVSGLTIHPALTYLRSKVGSYVTYNDSGTLQNVGGNPLPYAPKLSGAVDAEYDMQVGDYTAFVGGHAQIESGTSPDLSQDAMVRIPGYSLFDARLGVRSQSNWHASFWVRNLANHYYWTNVISSGDDFIKLTGLPRTAGFTFGVNFR